MWEELFGFAIHRLVVEKPREFGVFHHYGRVFLDGGEVFFLEGVAGFRRRKDFAGQGNGDVGIRAGNPFRVREGFVNADDKFRDIVQPGELRIIDDQAEKLAGGEFAMFFFILTALHFKERFVDAQEGLAQSDQLLAGWSVS